MIDLRAPNFPINASQSHEAVPGAWYNLLADRGMSLPTDLPPSSNAGRRGAVPQLRIPPTLLRQEQSSQSWIPIPTEVIESYRQYRPTPLRRARVFEKSLGTAARIYYKYEGGNISGSHKLNTALAQAYYYKRAGARRLVVGTGAGQWGTAVAAACAVYGLELCVYMVRSSSRAKPYRRSLMTLLGAEMVESPSDRTAFGRAELARISGNERSNPASGGFGGTLAVALAEALEDGSTPGSMFCTGSGETYSLLHQTVIGLEAAAQLDALGERPDAVVASLGAGSNLGGLALPFLAPDRADGTTCVSVESTACPKLTRGVYAYDHTDASDLAPLQKMYTLGSSFAPPAMHAGGLRYHGTAKLISALYDEGAITARAYGQRSVLASAAEFARCEGILPAPESAHAVHGAAERAREADAAGRPECILIGISGHGLLDMAAYEAFSAGTLEDAVADEAELARALANLPAQPDKR